MFTEGVIQQIESALGSRHPQADALLHQRVEFICKKIEQLRKDARPRGLPDSIQEALNSGDGTYRP